MDLNIVRFHHFTSKESYCKLQEEFIAYDYVNGRDEEKIENPFIDREIVLYDRDFITNEDIYISKEYKKDFLIPQIYKLNEYYYDFFRKEIITKGLQTEKLQEGWSYTFNDRLVEIRKTILKAEYLEGSLRYKLIQQIKLLREMTEGYIKNPYPHINHKLQFNWKKTDIIYFFHLLRENNEISPIGYADLGRILNSVCEYKNKDDFKPITRARRDLQEFKNDYGKSTIKPNNRLKEIFTNEDFFNH